MQSKSDFLKTIPLPAVIIDLDAFDSNTRKIALMGKKIRIATKSLRVPALISRILKHGSPFQGLMTFSAHETEFLASNGFDDFLLAYPAVRQDELQALARIHDSGKTIRMIIDSQEHIDLLEKCMPKGFRVMVEVDMSLRLLGGSVHLGVRRSPIHDASALLLLVDKIRACKNLVFDGVMGYEAQVAGLGDQNPFKELQNPAAAVIRRLSVRKTAQLRGEIDSELKARGIAIPIFNAGGSGSLNFAATEPWVTELTAGSGWYSPHLFDYYSNIRFKPSCFFGLSVVRKADDGIYTCQGGGTIASGAPGWDRVPVPVWPEGLRLVSAEGCGEVQTPVISQTPLTLGQPVIFRHAKAGELLEHFKQVHLISKDILSKGIPVETVPSYRGLGLCFF